MRPSLVGGDRRGRVVIVVANDAGRRHELAAHDVVVTSSIPRMSVE